VKSLDDFTYPPGHPDHGRRAGIVHPILTAAAMAAVVGLAGAGAALEALSRPHPRRPPSWLAWLRPQRCPHCPHRVTDSPRGGIP